MNTAATSGETRARGAARRVVLPGLAWPGGPWVALALVALAALQVAPDAAYDPLYALVTTLAAVNGLHAYRVRGTTVTLTLALGLVGNALGDVVWTVQDALGGAPDAGPADVFYLAAYVGIGAALVAATVRRTPGGRLHLDSALDAVTVVTVSVLLLWALAPTAALPQVGERSWAAALTLAAYPVLDAVMVALALRSLGRSTISRAHVALVLGILLWMGSDLAYLVLPDGANEGTWMDLGWMLGALGLSLAAWWPLEAPELDPSGDRDTPVIARVAVATVPLTLPGVLMLIASSRRSTALGVAAGVALAVLLVVAVLRTLRLLESERRARAAARASYQYYARLAATGSDAVLVLDARGRVQDPGARLAAVVSEIDDPLSVPWHTLLRVRQPDAARSAFEDVVSSPGRQRDLEMELGDGRWFSARLVNLLDDRVVGGVVLALSDSTSLHRAAEQLERARDAAEEASQAKSQFLAQMSHEIRTPLNGVLGLNQLLSQSTLDERQRGFVGGIDTAGRTLRGLIDDLLDLSKAEAGQMQLEHVPFDLGRTLEETAAMLAPRADAQGLDLVVSYDPVLAQQRVGDPGRIGQILLNVGSNAVKFTHTGSVRLDARPAPGRADHVVLTVTDTGIGLSAEQQQRIFEPFAQADESTSRRYGGTGLGLAITRQLTEAMGGHIELTSLPGHGSVFSITVPLPPALGEPVESPDLSGRTVVVLAGAWVAQAAAEHLRHWHADVRLVPDVATLSAQVEQGDLRPDVVDLLLLDLDLPLGAADQARRVLGRDHRLALCLTDTDVSRALARQLGADEVLVKPVRPSRLRTTALRLATQDAGRAADPEGDAALPWVSATASATRPGSADSAPASSSPGPAAGPSAGRTPRDRRALVPPGLPGANGEVLVLATSSDQRKVLTGLLEYLGHEVSHQTPGAPPRLPADAVALVVDADDPISRASLDSARALPQVVLALTSGDPDAALRLPGVTAALTKPVELAALAASLAAPGTVAPGGAATA